MPTATIVYEQTMTHWPPESTLVKLDPPLKRFDPVTGKPVLHQYIAVQRQSTIFGAHEDATFLFPSDEEGGFVQEHMSPLEKRDAGMLHSVLKAMGYDVAN